MCNLICSTHCGLTPGVRGHQRRCGDIARDIAKSKRVTSNVVETLHDANTFNLNKYRGGAWPNEYLNVSRPQQTNRTPARGSMSMSMSMSMHM